MYLSSAHLDLDICCKMPAIISENYVLTCLSFSSGQEFGRLVTAIIGMASNSGDSQVPRNTIRDWECLALRVLATLSYKLKGSGYNERALWPTVSSNLPFLEKQLTRLLVGTSTVGMTGATLSCLFRDLMLWVKLILSFEHCVE